MLAFLTLALAAGPDWRPLDEAAITEARDHHKWLFLDVEAVWCHWCHVMDATTYTDPRVLKALSKHFVPVRVDQDARPDLSRRYRDYGWPALVVLDPDTLDDLAIGSGYHEVDELLALLEAGRKRRGAPARPVADRVMPTGDAGLTDPQREALEARLVGAYDAREGGWGRAHKYVPWRNVEWELLAGDPDGRARQTLDAGRALIDPVWGGVYQYSTHGDWEHAHFEKIMRFQGEIARVYALAYQVQGRPEDLQAARDILRHVTTFLDDPSGGFHTSQDADLVPGEHSAGYFALDDAGRRALGVPRVDPHVYAGETGLAVVGLVALARASGERAPLERAERAGAWLLAERARPDGLFAREGGGGPPFLADQVEVGRAFLALHQATGERRWLDATASMLEGLSGFRHPEAGFLTGLPAPAVPAPVCDRDENAKLARLANLVGHATGNRAFHDLSDHAMRFVAADAGSTGWHVGGVLVTDAERRTAPVHVVIVGEPSEALLAATAGLGPYAVVERLAPGEAGANGVEYPDLGAAAFFCAEGRCSPPITEADVLADQVRRWPR
ncbi:MAG: DUF255 domain-containing protein [Myxococcota bacterium]